MSHGGKDLDRLTRGGDASVYRSLASGLAQALNVQRSTFIQYSTPTHLFEWIRSRCLSRNIAQARPKLQSKQSQCGLVAFSLLSRSLNSNI
jgi:hypothetical protein